MNIYFHRYLKISLFNLLIVATIGVVLRYKILFPLPFIDQKFLLHGHSHFAFAGWITQTLMVLMIAYLSKQSGKNQFESYNKLLLANLLTAYGMLISFPFQGYGAVSITFSTVSIFVFYYFAIRFWRDLNKLLTHSIVHFWFKAALVLGALSSIGTFSLAYMMMTKNIHQNFYLAAVYFYLHFQYNGWFFFACMGLFHFLLPVEIQNKNQLNLVFKLFVFAIVPAYFLSTLWMDLPLYIFVFVILASCIQVIAWIILLRILIKEIKLVKEKLPKVVQWLIGMSAFAVTIKLLLQLGSTFPSLSQLAFGFRSIVIAYLHLVLLGVITLFMLGYIFSESQLKPGKTTIAGLFIFVNGVFLNELVLMFQGIASFSYNSIPYANELLFGLALILFTGILLVLTGLCKSSKKNEIYST